MNDGKLLFLRYKNPTLDPVLKTYEIWLYNPHTEKITFLQKYNEKIYILPVVSRDRTTISYHSLIEGTDFLVTRNIDTGYSTRLRFDTGGYFVNIAIDYDNDRIVSVNKRGENRQALYIISNSRGTIRRIFNGRNFQNLGFFNNRSIYYTDRTPSGMKLGVVQKRGKEGIVAAAGVDFVQKAPNGDALLYSKDGALYLYRVNNSESIKLSQNFIGRPIISQDGSTCAIIEKSSVLIVNIPSGDVMYFLSMDTENTTRILTDFTFYIAKDNKIFHLKHKKPGQYLTEAYADEEQISLLAASSDDLYLYFQRDNKKKIIILDRKQKRKLSKEFPFTVQEVLPCASPKLNVAFYIKALSKNPEDSIPIRELYRYNFKQKILIGISTAQDTDIHPYFWKE